MATISVWLATAGIGVLAVLHLIYTFFYKPLLLISHLRRQGVPGFPFRPFFGQLPDAFKMKALADQAGEAELTPYLSYYSKKYGNIWFDCIGPTVRVVVADPVILRDAYVSNNSCYHKSHLFKAFRLLGEGLLTSGGQLWTRQRKLINPAFYPKELKRMYSTMISCAMASIHSWNKELDAGAQELDMYTQFGSLTLSIISRTAFGADLGGTSADADAIPFRFRTYVSKVAKYIQTQQMNPLYRHIPTKLKRAIDDDERCVREMAMALIKARRAGRAIKKPVGELSHESTGNLLTWTVMLLSDHPEWQDRCRKEVLDVCGSQDPPSFEHLSQLTNIQMVLYESLRLYPIVPILSRQCVHSNKLGEIEIPEGVDINIPVSYIQRRPDLWGKDAEEFKPERFANGPSKAATHPMAFLSFSVGPRGCIGQNFSLMEAKLILALMLQNYSWKLAPGYRHCPDFHVSLQPKYGMPVVLKRRTLQKE